MKLFLPEYSYLWEIIQQVINQEKVSIDEFNAVGGRKSGKTVAFCLLFGLLMMLPFKVGLICIRAGKDKSKEFYKDMKEVFDSFDIPYKENNTKLTLSYGVNEIRFVGVNTLSKYKAKNSGLARIGNVKYIFKYYEERFEFNTDDYQAMQEALRGMTKDIQMITINVCNPWAKSSQYIQYCNSYQQWDVNQLKQTGSQVGVYEETDYETKITVRKLFHYTNWRVAKDVLSMSEINEIRNTWKIDRNRALTTDFGLPGYEFGAIYTHLLHKVGTPVYQGEGSYILAGMDYGWSQREIGGKTVCYFGTANLENGVDILNEYVHDNAKNPKSVNLVAEEIVKFYINAVNFYVEQTGTIGIPQVMVRVDNMAVGVITVLNNIAQQYRVNHWLQFTKCRKYPIQDRIELTIHLLGANYLRISNSCSTLFKEFELAHYEETETQKRAKENDHALNAFEYAIEGVMYKLARTLGLERISDSTMKRSGLW